MFHKLKMVAAAATLGLFATTANSATIDADIVFVIDKSGSMQDEFDFLGGAIEGFLNDLQADSRIGTARAGLVTFGGTDVVGQRAGLQQDLTSNAATLKSSFDAQNASGSREDAYEAVEASINDLGISYTPGNVVSLVLITDEGQDSGFYDGFTETSIGALLDARDFLLNIIYDTGDATVTGLFDGIARPASGLFDIVEFRNNRDTFFQGFTNTKLEEIIDQGGDPDPDPDPTPGVIPLPAAGWLLLGGVAGLGALKRRKKAQTA